MVCFERIFNTEFGDIVVRTPKNSDIKYMRDLWKITFCDDDKYLDLIFNDSLDLRYCLVVFLNNTLISMSVGLPYNFYKDSICLKGLYLCGLSTINEYRGKGIMRRVLDLIPEICNRYSCSFSFLIPADNNLRNYYSKFGYFDSARKRTFLLNGGGSEAPSDMIDLFSNFVSSNEILIFQSKDQILKATELFHRSIEKCIAFERSFKCFHIVHSYDDWKNIFIDKLQSGYRILVDVSSDISSIIAFNEAGGGEIFCGELSSIKETFRKLGITSTSMDYSDVAYGMVRFNEEIYVKICDYSKGSENPIFENDCTQHQKYGKMNFERFSEISMKKLCGEVYFEYMLE